jgi:hypothetical protein
MPKLCNPMRGVVPLFILFATQQRLCLAVELHRLDHCVYVIPLPLLVPYLLDVPATIPVGRSHTQRIPIV